MTPNSDEPSFPLDQTFLPEPDSDEITQPQPPNPDIRGPGTVSLDFLLTKGFEPTYPPYARSRKQARQRLAKLLRRSLPLGSQQREIVRLIVGHPEEFLKNNGEVNQSHVADRLGLHQTTVWYHLQQMHRYL